MQIASTHAWRVVALKKNSYLLASELFVKNTFASSCCRIVVGLSSCMTKCWHIRLFSSRALPVIDGKAIYNL